MVDSETIPCCVFPEKSRMLVDEQTNHELLVAVDLVGSLLTLPRLPAFRYGPIIAALLPSTLALHAYPPDPRC